VEQERCGFPPSLHLLYTFRPRVDGCPAIRCREKEREREREKERPSTVFEFVRRQLAPFRSLLRSLVGRVPSSSGRRRLSRCFVFVIGYQRAEERNRVRNTVSFQINTGNSERRSAFSRNVFSRLTDVFKLPPGWTGGERERERDCHEHS